MHPADSLGFTSYLRRLGLTLLVGAFIALGFIVVIDPYNLYGFVDRAGINTIKPYPERYLTEIKIAHAAKERADTIILGNSRAEIGFDPDHAGFAQRRMRAHNLAVPGSSFDHNNVTLARLRAQGIQPKHLLVGLDFMDFAGSATRNTRANQSPPLASEWRWRFDTLFSLTSVIDAVKTLRIQKAKEPDTLARSGLNPLLGYNAFARADGYYVMFRQRAEENARVYLRWLPALTQKRIEGSEEWKSLQLLLSTAAKQHASLDLVIYPYHAQLVALYEVSGVWPAFERWKEAVALEIDAVRRAHPELNIRLWDFSGFGAARCERIPARGDRTTATQWYWESGHFKKALGDIVLDQILLNQSNPELPATLLTPTTVADNHQRIHAERAACEAQSPELFAEVRTVADKARLTLPLR